MKAIRVSLILILGLTLMGCAMEEPAQPQAAPGSPATLVVGCDSLSGNFSPFFADTGNDQDVASLTGLDLLTTDRSGAVVRSAIRGETLAYNGTDYLYTGPADLDFSYDEETDLTTYTWTLRNDLLFSDGRPLTADDVIFSYYVYCDESYDGLSTVAGLPILGLNSYYLGLAEEDYQAYRADFAAAIDSGLAYTSDPRAWELVDQAWLEDVLSIREYCLEYYADMAEDYIGFTEEELAADEGVQTLFAMYMWVLGDFNEEGGFYGYDTGAAWDLADSFPTIEDMLHEAQEKYNYDPQAYSAVESLDISVYDAALSAYALERAEAKGRLDRSTGIAGIERLDDYQVRVTLEGYDAAAIYGLDITIAPLHYYGDPSLYDYEGGSFGFPKGDLTSVKAKSGQPLGAGPYAFSSYENKTVYFLANENYFAGRPLIDSIQFKETPEADKVSGLLSGLLDIAEPAFTPEISAEIREANSNGELSGDRIYTSSMDFLGYGYLGLNADTVNVAGDGDSPQSISLRKGLATILAAYRELAITSFYGDTARVIEYPISSTSWAAPHPLDPGYQVAYSLGPEGQPIYEPSMSAEERYAAALAETIKYFQAAGYTWDDEAGKFTAAPPGAKLEYEIIVPGEGQGDHAALLMADQAAEALESVGITLLVIDPSDTQALWDRMYANTQELWCAAREVGLDPDLYQLYHSDSIGLGNYSNISLPELDELIMAARLSDDREFRRLTYKSCLDLVLEQAVEVPLYQRQECLIFNADHLDISTLTPDMTTYWGWEQGLGELALSQ